MPVLLTVRGSLVPRDLEAARKLHDDTAGSPQGIAGARALGDLSHKVYAPCAEAGAMSGAKAGELLFVDNWVDAAGIQAFFGHKEVQQQAGKLFGARDAAVWMPARGGFAVNLESPKGKSERYLAMLRATVASGEEATAAFNAAAEGGLREARARGLLSHALYMKLGEGSAEVLGVDLWCSLSGLLEHYGEAKSMTRLAPVFTGPPAASVWEEPKGSWSEW